jgi:ubiquinone/menaquinone biosynthesis C-methylase UbiE
MLSLFDDFSGKNVVDAGCGTGFYTLHALRQNATVTAIDASGKMLDHVENEAKSGNLRLLCADLAEGLPGIQDETQDYIVCSLALHYIENWETLVRDFARVLKPGGKAYISTHHPFTDYLHLEKENYFSKEFVKDTWGSKKKPYIVHYFSRPLTDIIKPFLRPDLKIINIEEPKPDERYRKLNEKAFKKLSEKPGFLFLTIQKGK